MEGMDKEIQELFETFKQIVNDQDKKINDLTDKLNEVLGGAEAAYNDWDYKNRLNDFGKDADWDKYSKELKLIEGDDFDFKKKVFDDYNALQDKPEEAEYIAGVIAHVADQLQKLKEAFNEAEVPVAEVEAKAEDNKPVEVEAKDNEGDKVAEAEAVAKPEEPKSEPLSEEEEFIKQLEDDKAKADKDHIGN